MKKLSHLLFIAALVMLAPAFAGERLKDTILPAGICMVPAIGPSGVSSGRWVAWTDKPPEKWEDAFVTGNGRHGTMVMGQPGEGRIICVHEELLIRSWDRDIVAVADIANLLPEVRRLVDEDKTNAAAKLAVDEGRRQLTEMGAASSWTHTPHPAFDLRIRTGKTDNRVGYRRQLDLETGEEMTRWDGFKQRLFSSRSHNANVILLRASAGHKLDVTLNLEDTPGIPTKTFRSLSVETSPGGRPIGKNSPPTGSTRMAHWPSGSTRDIATSTSIDTAPTYILFGQAPNYSSPVITPRS